MKKRIGISAKLVTGFLAVAVVVCLVGFMGYYGIRQSNEVNQDLIKHSDLMKSILQREIDHFNFRNKVGEFQRNAAMVTIDVEKDYHRCGLGKWYYGEDRKKAELLLPVIRDLLVKLEEPHKKLHESIIDLENILKKGPSHREEAVKFYGNNIQEHFRSVVAILNDIVKTANDATEQNKKKAETLLTRIIFFSFLVIAAGFIISILFGLTLSSAVSNPINKITVDLFTSSNSLESAANQVSSSSQELSSGASELASSVEEMTSSLEELQSIIESNTKNINEAELLMRETNEGARNSSKKMDDMQITMGDINENSKKIVKIIKVIDDIAFQTNILALNAAVEAARAGDAGRGFAVVAEQVKTLAQKSAEAAKETADLIDKAIESVSRGEQRGNEVKGVLVKAVDLAAKVGTLLDEINRASKEQLKGATQVTKAVSQINTVVQGTAASSEETAAAGEELLSQAEMLKQVVTSLNGLVKGAESATELSQISLN